MNILVQSREMWQRIILKLNCSSFRIYEANSGLCHARIFCVLAGFYFLFNSTLAVLLARVKLIIKARVTHTFVLTKPGKIGVGRAAYFGRSFPVNLTFPSHSPAPLAAVLWDTEEHNVLTMPAAQPSAPGFIFQCFRTSLSPAL